MSAVASIITPREAILLSDGYAVDISGIDPDNFTMTEDRIVSRHRQKALRISDSVGVLWTGSGVDLIDECIETLNADSGAAVARHISQFLKKHTDHSLYANQLYSINIHVIFYEGRKISAYQVTTGSELKPKKLNPGIGIQCMSALRDMSDTQQELFSLYNTYRATKPPREAAIEAFTAFVEADPLLGGEIFSETIKPAYLQGR